MRRNSQFLAAALCLALPAIPAAQRVSYVTTLGRDTLALEQFVRTRDVVAGDWISLYGGIMVHHYEMRLRPDGTVADLRLTLHRLSGRDEGTTTIHFESDSVFVRTPNGKEQRLAVGTVSPLIAQTVAPFDLIISRARATHRDSTVAPVISAFGPYRAGGIPVVFVGADSARFGNPRAPLVARIDAEGHIAGMSARATTTRTEARRVANFDIFATAAHFPNVADSVNIAGVPAISPRDTVRATIGDASIVIDYGRPAVRGRDVFAHGVLGDSLWRTGANAATQFMTTRDLVIGRDTLRAGKYSVWTRVSPDNSTYALVFNSQTGQWGTEHHADRDVLSVPLSPSSLPSRIERFTIRLPDSPRSSRLVLEWGDRMLAVPIASPRPAVPDQNVNGRGVAR